MIDSAIRTSAHALVDSLDGSEAVEDIAVVMQSVLSEALSSIIDAGSERDAMMEDERLFLSLREFVSDWVNHKQ
jgi:hypothetical protein